MPETVFTPAAFLRTSNIYEVNIRQYTPEGTFNAFATHLPRLKEMNVEILWLMPIHPIGTVKRKGTLGSYYSIQDHKTVNPEFGTAEDFKNLVGLIHAQGMCIILDWVANHTAWDHVWTKSNPEFFVHDENGNFKPPFDWDDVLQIDHANTNEQAAMIDAMQYWISEFDIDGFRADLAHLTPLAFWKDARQKLSGLKENLVWLAETENPEYHEVFDISYTWEWMHATEQLIKKEISLSACLSVLDKYKTNFPAQAQRLFFTSNHDENSWNGTEYEKYGVFAKALAVFSYTYPGSIPLMYSGQEVPNKKRLKFFDKDLIEWTDHPDLLGFYKILAQLHRRSKALSGANPGFYFFPGTVEQDVLAYTLSGGHESVLVFLNMKTEAISADISMNDITGNYRDIFSGEMISLNKEYLFSAEPGAFKVFEKVASAE